MSGFALYVHWPFCQAKCPYCDFNSHVVPQIDETAWEEAYLSEIKRFSEKTEGRALSSIFFGGGTPSLMSGDLVARVMDGIRAAWPLDEGCEITLEANPTSVEADRFKTYREAGVNRVSMGVQALNDPDLKRLGRLHSVAEAEAAFATAREVFDRVSFDLIYARQDQTLSDWEAELRRALDMSIDHLSLYQLTIEPDTAFGDRFARGGLKGLPDEDLGADMFELTQTLCAEAGMPAYEISNHARDGAQSRHNLIYWTGGDYVGIGPGAHGRLTLNGTRTATEAVSAPFHWLKGARSGETTEFTPLSRADELGEALLMGLRIREGVALDWITPLTTPEFEKQRDRLISEGYLEMTNSHLRPTERGKLVLNAVVRELLPEE